MLEPNPKNRPPMKEILKEMHYEIAKISPSKYFSKEEEKKVPQISKEQDALVKKMIEDKQI